MIVVLDTGVAGELARPSPRPDLHTWLVGLLGRGRLVCLPEVVDYELRREFLRARMTASIQALDALPEIACEYLPLTTAAIRRAAQLWADLRQAGQPTADARELDVDCVLAAQAQIRSESEGREVVIATTNVGHLGRLANARTWREIS